MKRRLNAQRSKSMNTIWKCEVSDADLKSNNSEVPHHLESSLHRVHKTSEVRFKSPSSSMKVAHSNARIPARSIQFSLKENSNIYSDGRYLETERETQLQMIRRERGRRTFSSPEGLLFLHNGNNTQHNAATKEGQRFEEVSQEGVYENIPLDVRESNGSKSLGPGTDDCSQEIDKFPVKDMEITMQHYRNSSQASETQLQPQVLLNASLPMKMPAENLDRLQRKYENKRRTCSKTASKPQIPIISGSNENENSATLKTEQTQELKREEKEQVPRLNLKDLTSSNCEKDIPRANNPVKDLGFKCYASTIASLSVKFENPKQEVDGEEKKSLSRRSSSLSVQRSDDWYPIGRTLTHRS